jgi:histidinol-phosphate aminotransferase
MPSNLIRTSVQKLHAYVPGEQPKIKGLIKLNTNENPYPPAPAVLKATREAVDARLRLYPNPTAEALREKLAALHGCSPDNIIVGNGSDELLALACRAFVDTMVAAGNLLRNGRRATIQYFTPSYSLYPVLANIHGAAKSEYALKPHFALPTKAELRRDPGFNHRAALTYITTPNAPSGRSYSTAHLEDLCSWIDGVVVLDEAYADFARENAMRLALSLPNVLVARTFSKAYSLCFQRVGYCVGPVDLIAALHKVRDSYNVNGLGQVAALATLDNLPYYRANFKKIIETRQWLSEKLTELGFEVLPSETNFILAEPPRFEAGEWALKLREKKVLVRWFNQNVVRRFLRITIGTPKEAEALLSAAKSILK